MPGGSGRWRLAGQGTMKLAPPSPVRVFRCCGMRLSFHVVNTDPGGFFQRRIRQLAMTVILQATDQKKLGLPIYSSPVRESCLA